MLPLFPDIKPYKVHELAVQEPHRLYVEESGNPDGIPVLFVHGGPGIGADPKSRCYFDPEHYRIIVFDQRGAGRSTPHACLEHNHTGALMSDMEQIREELGVSQWMLFGGSWGSTLSLAYAQTYPEYVLGLVLRGIFLCRQRDLNWFYRDGASRVFPDYWQEFVDGAPDCADGDYIGAYYRALTDDNELARMAAAKSWSAWEAQCATLRPHPEVLEHMTEAHTALSLARIESHFFVNSGFLEGDQLLHNAGRLDGIPGIIVHGRYDMICPLDNALALHEAWPDSDLHIVRDAGHAASEPGIVDALVHATDEMAKRLRQ